MTLTCPRPLHHIAIGVSDIDAAIKWYSEVLGYGSSPGSILTLEEDARGQLKDVLGPKFRKGEDRSPLAGSGAGIEMFEAVDPPTSGVRTTWNFGRAEFSLSAWSTLTSKGWFRGFWPPAAPSIQIWDDRPTWNYRMVYAAIPSARMMRDPHAQL